MPVKIIIEKVAAVGCSKFLHCRFQLIVQCFKEEMPRTYIIDYYIAPWYIPIFVCCTICLSRFFNKQEHQGCTIDFFKIFTHAFLICLLRSHIHHTRTCEVLHAYLLYFLYMMVCLCPCILFNRAYSKCLLLCFIVKYAEYKRLYNVQRILQ